MVDRGGSSARAAGTTVAPARPSSARESSLPILALGALGVVYGDIGTSPLYALRNCFVGDRAIPPSPENVLGILSLVVWALVVVISVKYLTVLMRADNQGEGGILALLALALAPRGAVEQTARARRGIAAIGIFGAALLYGDGVITPAISVLSAMEGLNVATQTLEPVVIPLTVVILAGLFLLQRHGTGKVAIVFGPAMVVWFVVIGALGLRAVLNEQPGHPSVWNALDPSVAIAFLASQGATAFFVLGSVVLVVTGAEALYADMGHFHAGPIRLAWYVVVFPALLLNYLGQGVLMLEGGSVGRHPFFDLAPDGFLYPLVALSTVATVIASQALISGAFSLTHQAIVLGYAPRLPIIHTSDVERGQIYIPQVNYALMVLCILTVLGFRSSDALGSAYGIAVTGTMTITSLLFYRVARHQWCWSRPLAGALTAFFLVFDLAFLTANLDKLDSGGWVPLAIAIAVFVVMTTWKRGKQEHAALLAREGKPADVFLADLETDPPQMVPGTVVYWTAVSNTVPRLLQRNVQVNHVRHERVVMLSTGGVERPRVSDDDRVTVLDLGGGLYRVYAIFGFMEQPHIARILACAARRGLLIDPEQSDFFVAHDSLLPTGSAPMAHWRKRLFCVLHRLTPPIAQSHGVPPSRVLLVGSQLEL